MIGAISDCISVQYHVEHLSKALSVAILEPLGVRCEIDVDAGGVSGEHCEVLGLVIAELDAAATHS
jgi:hypothetical protein